MFTWKNWYFISVVVYFVVMIPRGYMEYRQGHNMHLSTICLAILWSIVPFANIILAFIYIVDMLGEIQDVVVIPGRKNNYYD